MKFNALKHAKIDNISLQNNIIQKYDKPVIGLDRDGVINFNAEDGEYVWKREQFKPIPGSLEAIAMMRSKGYKIVIITNQGGIAKGKYTQSDVDYLHNEVLFKLLGEAGCSSIDGLYYSASSEKTDYYAKPNIGMFKRAETEISGIKFSDGWYVGDSMRDLKAAHKMNSKLVLVRTGYGKKTEEELNKFVYRELKKNTVVYDNLLQFAKSLN